MTVRSKFWSHSRLKGHHTFFREFSVAVLGINIPGISGLGKQLIPYFPPFFKCVFAGHSVWDTSIVDFDEVVPGGESVSATLGHWKGTTNKSDRRLTSTSICPGTLLPGKLTMLVAHVEPSRNMDSQLFLPEPLVCLPLFAPLVILLLALRSALRLFPRELEVVRMRMEVFGQGRHSKTQYIQVDQHGAFHKGWRTRVGLEGLQQAHTVSASVLAVQLAIIVGLGHP